MTASTEEAGVVVLTTFATDCLQPQIDMPQLQVSLTQAHLQLLQLLQQTHDCVLGRVPDLDQEVRFQQSTCC
jgi:hypothetical protein